MKWTVLIVGTLAVTTAIAANDVVISAADNFKGVTGVTNAKCERTKEALVFTDILYDMLSSFDEDSVKIYAGLVHPKESTPLEAAPVAEPDPEPEVEEEDESADEEMTGLVPRMKPAQPAPAPEPEPVPAAEAEPAASADEPEQLALIEDVEEPAPKPKPRTRRKRASVPSWDEIMFGGGKGD